MVADTDWSIISEQTVTCWCGNTYRGKAKGVSRPDGAGFYIAVEHPAPCCGALDAKHARSDPEEYAL